VDVTFLLLIKVVVLGFSTVLQNNRNVESRKI